MSLFADIKRRLGAFSLDMKFESDARRIGILGPSGCGKSLTLKSIAGIERPDLGTVAVDGRVLFDSSSKTDVKPQKRNIGYMFQSYALFPTMTVAQNIGAGLRLPAAEKQERVREMTERFRLEGLDAYYPSQLSGGQQQRVALARIMAYRPQLILLDEPFSALDQHLKERLQHEMAELLSDYAGQIVMVSHDRNEIYRFADEILVMEDGRLLAQGPTREIFKDPGSARVARITGCKNISAAERIDAHTLRLTDWGVTVRTEREVPEDITAVGYRAHHFEPVWDDGQEADDAAGGAVNCLPCRVAGVDELPFERRYYIDVPGSGEEGSSPEPVCWFIQDSERRALEGRPMPDRLRMKEEDIMLLRQQPEDK